MHLTTTLAPSPTLHRLGIALVASGVLLAAPLHAQASSIDLTGPAGTMKIVGPSAGALTGLSVAGAGDVNGDGRPDVIIAAKFASPRGRTNAGAAYVVYGGQNLGSVKLGHLGTSGFEIDGAAANNEAGDSVAGGGDVNGDGIADVIIGASDAANNGRINSGSAYVIYGQRVADPADVDLANITTTEGGRGFRIDGASMTDQAGRSVALTDVTGDGLADAIVGAIGAAPGGHVFAGSAYVVYGQATPDLADLDLASVGGVTTTKTVRGFRIDGAIQNDELGATVGGAGDVNGDGIGDVLIGAPGAGNEMRTDSGSAYVVYGSNVLDRSAIAVGSISPSDTSLWFRIDGATANDDLGYSVAGAGDVNGDGVADVVVGAVGAHNNARPSSGSAYVLYGQRTADPADVDLAAITTTQATRGMRIDGAAPGDDAGYSVAGVGDLNGDGVDDLAISSPTAANNGRPRSGSVNVIYGQRTADPGDVDLADLTGAQTSRGVRIDGASTGELAGAGVGRGGDLNGDGHPDLVIGAPVATTTSPADGAVYTVDLAAPETTLNPGPPLTRDATPTFTFHGSEPGSFRCSVDRGSASFVPCSGPSGTHTPRGPLADGTYTSRVAAVDGSGNVDPTPATRTFKIDATAPNTTITAHPRAKLTLRRHRHQVTVAFRFAASEPGSAFRCKLDRGTYRACHSPLRVAVKAGRHTLSVVATDAVGNTDPSAAAFTFVAKPSPPPRASRRRR